jgi:hypothetical protein
MNWSMNWHVFKFRRIGTLLATIGAAASVTGCGRALLFAESDGVNFAIRANAASSPPLEVNFGLNRTIATVVPPNKQSSDGKATGDAVNMFAGFQVDAGLEGQKIDADVKIASQFASGRAATAVGHDPQVVAKITKIGPPTVLTFGDDGNTALLQAYLNKPGTTTIDPDHRQQILAAMKSAAGIEGISVTSFIFAKEYAAGRRLVVAALKLNE